MFFLRKLFSYWALLVIMAIFGYVLLYNQEPAFVSLPGIGQFKVISAIAYLACFVLGATFVSIFFCVDYLRTSWEISNLKRTIKKLRQQSESMKPIGVSKGPGFDRDNARSQSPRSKETFPPEGELF